MKREKLNCAKVNWIDSNGWGVWHARTDEKNEASVIVSIGQIEMESKEAITLKLSHDFTLDRIDSTITIPKCSIKSIARFRK